MSVCLGLKCDVSKESYSQKALTSMESCVGRQQMLTQDLARCLTATQQLNTTTSHILPSYNPAFTLMIVQFLVQFRFLLFVIEFTTCIE